MNSSNLKLCMRVAEYNLQANKFFSGNILFQDTEKQKELRTEREKLIIAVLNKFSKCDVNKVLRAARFRNIDGSKTHNITTKLEELEALLNESSINIYK